MYDLSLRWCATVFGAAILAALASCGGDDTAPGAEALAREYRLVTRTNGSTDEPGAEIGGTLAIDARRRCTLLSGRPVVWPLGTQMRDSPLAVVLPGGEEVRSGDSLTGGGGTIPLADIAALSNLIEGRRISDLRACAFESEDVTFFAASTRVRVTGAHGG